MWPFKYGEPVSVIRAGQITDPYSGEVTEDWKNPTEFDPVPDCAVDNWRTGETAEPTDDRTREPIIDGLRVFGPPHWDVTGRDRMRVRGIVWEVYGEPFAPRSPFTGWEPGTAVNLRKVRG